jgi:hypothetical protein
MVLLVFADFLTFCMEVEFDNGFRSYCFLNLEEEYVGVVLFRGPSGNQGEVGSPSLACFPSVLLMLLISSMQVCSLSQVQLENILEIQVVQL